MKTPVHPKFNKQGTYSVVIDETGIAVSQFTEFRTGELPIGKIFIEHGYVIDNDQTYPFIEVRNRLAEQEYPAFEIGDNKRILDIVQLAVKGRPIFRFDFADDNGVGATRFRWYDKDVTGLHIDKALTTGLNEVLALSSTEVDKLPPSQP